MAALPRRDPFAKQNIPGEEDANQPAAPKAAPARAPKAFGAGSAARVPALNPFGQGSGPGYPSYPVGVSPRPAEQENEPEFVLTGIVRGSQNVAIIKVGDEKNAILSNRAGRIDGGYKLLSITSSDCCVLVHKIDASIEI